MTLPRRCLLLIFLLSTAGVVVALLSQHVLGMRPCAWCVFQRLILLAVAASSLLGWLLGTRARTAGPLAAIVSGALGLGGIVSAWYQYSVAAVQFSCEQTVADRFMSGSGLDAALPWLFGIYATCMDARVNLLGIEYALWGLGLFAAITVLSVLALLKHVRA